MFPSLAVGREVAAFDGEGAAEGGRTVCGCNEVEERLRLHHTPMIGARLPEMAGMWSKRQVMD